MFGWGFSPLQAQPSSKSSEVPADILQKYLPDAGQAPATQPVAPAVAWLGRQHVMVLHFPIALAVVAVLAELIFLLGRKPEYRLCARFLTILAALSSVATVAVGWCAAQSALASGRPVPLLPLHRNLGLCAMGLLIAVALMREGSFLQNIKGQWLYRFGLFGAFLLVVWTAYIGGQMVFGD